MRRVVIILILVGVAMAATLVVNHAMGWFDPAATTAALQGWAGDPATRPWAVLAMIAILAADSLWAVPTMPALILAGGLLGPWWGALAGTVGLVLSAQICYLLGRLGGPALVQRRCSPAEQARIAILAERDAVLVLVAGRSIPLLPELAALAVGLAGQPWRRFLVANLIGSTSLAVLAAWAGNASSLVEPWPAVAVGVGIPLLAAFWLLRRRQPQRGSPPA